MTGAVLQPQGENAYARDLRAAQSGLSQEAFKSAWTDGRTLSLGQAIDEALAAAQRPPPASESTAVMARRNGASLSQRELEIAALVARGMTNRQIAQQLVISRRTADRHVSNILNKLGFATRSQISAWTSERRILTAEVR